MSDHGLLVVAVAALATIAGVAAPIPELGFVVQFSGLGALIGTGVAYRARARRRGPSRWEIVTRWTLFRAFVGCAAAALARLLDSAL